MPHDLRHRRHRRRPGRPRRQSLPHRTAASTTSCSNAARVAERWRSERWDSLRLLTPNWMTRLPGWSYTRSRPGRVHDRGRGHRLLQCLRRRLPAAPVVEDSAVARLSDRPTAGSTSRPTGRWSAQQRRDRDRLVRPARGPRDRPAASIPPSRQVTPVGLPQPRARCPPGGVLVVGASATGVQLADELLRAGRDVVVAVGRPHPPAAPLPGHGHLLVAGADRQPRPHHRRDPRPRRRPSRTVRCSSSDDPTTATSTSPPSPPAASGSPGGSPPSTVTDVGFADDLAATSPTPTPGCGASSPTSTPTSPPPASPPKSSTPSRRPPSPWRRARPTSTCAAEGITTVIWATGYRRTYPWLHLPVLDAHGEIRHTEASHP